MVEIDNTPIGNATGALAHIFVGLIKADQGLSVSEVEKVEILIYKFRHDLPADYEEVHKTILAIHEDTDYKTWAPDDHLDKGMMAFDKFIASGESKPEHFENLYNLLEVVMEVGTISPGEERYLSRIYREFTSRGMAAR